ncbi:MAG: glycosyltransferase family 2 protein [Victivallaceae bacterium]|nr:glycosyltransferase family 2 protein [Victivallaceae bacterium]
MDALLTVVIPVYNEADVLPVVIKDITEYCQKRKWRLIMVNDGSSDNTGEILDGFSNDMVSVAHHKVNRGYGGALITGLGLAETKYAITIDADGQHCLEDIDRLLEVMQNRDADMIVGSRKGNKSSSWFRGLGKFVIRSLAKILMPLPIYDINSGMKIYNTKLIQQYLKFCPTNMAFSDIITLIFIRQRHLVLEEPISIRERQGSKSTINIMTAFDTIMEIVHIVIFFNPFKIFFPAAMLLFMVGMTWGGYCYMKNNQLSTASGTLLISSVIILLMGLISEQLSQIRRNL